MKFRKKPVVIDAVIVPHNPVFTEVPAWLSEAFKNGTLLWTYDANHRQQKLRVRTLEGPIYATPGDYLIRGIAGELYPCKRDIFIATYEPVIETEFMGIAVKQSEYLEPFAVSIVTNTKAGVGNA